jgi:predicted nucleic acid-binding protein
VPDVICDTSVIQYLFQVGLLDLLFTLYPEISIPEAVARELAQGQAHLIELPDNAAMLRFKLLKVSVPQSINTLKSLGSGEQEVLSLAAAIRIIYFYSTMPWPVSMRRVWVCDLPERWAFY